VAGAFLAGPTVGVATLLITQILKKPLSGIGESYYTVSGGWDDPEFVKVGRSGLDTKPFADCEKQLPTLSPEEIEAIQELIDNPRVQQSLGEDLQPEPQIGPVMPAPVSDVPVSTPDENAIN